MKKLLLILLLINLLTPAVGQKFTLSFNKNAQLTGITSSKGSIQYPTCLYKNDLVIDKSVIENLGSEFVDSVATLYKVFSALPAPLVTQRDILLYSTKTSLSFDLALLNIRIGLMNMTGGWGGLIYDSSSPYLPLQPTIGGPTLPVEVVGRPTNIVTDQTASQATLSLTTVANSTSIGYSLVRSQPDNSILSKHLEKTHNLYRGIPTSYKPLLQEAGALYRQHGPAIDKLLFQDSLRAPGLSLPYNAAVIDELVSLGSYPEQILKLEKQVLTDNEEWIKSWLWYTGGKIRLNPFLVFDPTLPLQEVETQLRIHTEQLKALQNQSASTNTEELTRLVTHVRTLEMQKEKLTTLPASYTAWIAQKSVVKKTLYQGTWHISNNDTIRWVHHTDATRNFDRLTKAADLPGMVALTDEVYVYSHNVKGEDKVALKSSKADFTPQTKLDLSLKEITGQFDLATSVFGLGLASIVGRLIPKKSISSEPSINLDLQDALSEIRSLGINGRNSYRRDNSTNLEAVINFLKPHAQALLTSKKFSVNLTNRLSPVSSLTSMIVAADEEIGQEALVYLAAVDQGSNVLFLQFLDNVYGVKDTVGYQTVLQDYRVNRAALNWLLIQTQPPLVLTLAPDNVPAFRTVANLTERKLDVTKSSTVTYQGFKNDAKEPDFEGVYNKYKLVRVLPTVGVAYVLKDRTATVFDEATRQFKTGTTFSNIEGLVGVKWYVLRKTNPARDKTTTKLIREAVDREANRKRGNGFVNTLFLTGGLGVSHSFLRNYYAGAGADIVPGLSIHIGGNFIFRKYYQLDNGTIIDQQERPKGFCYVSLSVDPGIAGSLIKLLLPGK